MSTFRRKDFKIRKRFLAKPSPLTFHTPQSPEAHSDLDNRSFWKSYPLNTLRSILKAFFNHTLPENSDIQGWTLLCSQMFLGIRSHPVPPVALAIVPRLNFALFPSTPHTTLPCTVSTRTLGQYTLSYETPTLMQPGKMGIVQGTLTQQTYGSTELRPMFTRVRQKVKTTHQ